MTHPIPCPESSLTPSHMQMPNVKNQTKPNRPMSAIDVPPMTISFQNKSFLFYKSKAIGRFPISTCIFQIECVFMHLWATNFWVYTVLRRTPFQHFYSLSRPMIMSNCECRVFHLGGGGGGRNGIYPNLLCPTHIFSFSKPCDSFWTLSYVTESTIEHQTQCRLLPCTHTHAMRCLSAECNAIMPLPIHTMPHTYGILYVHFKPCITPMHHLDNHINQHAISK